MRGNRTDIFILIICIGIASALIYRYKEINKGIPNSYEKQAYQINEDVDLDDLEIKVESYDIVKGSDEATNDKIFLRAQIKNESSNVIDASSLMFNSKLSDGFEYLDSFNIEEKDRERLKALKSKETLQFSVYYSSAPGRMNFDDGLKFYISNELYKNQITQKYNEGKFYAKYIELK